MYDPLFDPDEGWEPAPEMDKWFILAGLVVGVLIVGMGLAAWWLV